MSIGPLTIRWPESTAEWALFISVLTLVGNLLVFWWTRRERVIIKVNLRYRVSYERDRYLYPTVVEQHGLRTGDRCCLLMVKYRGRHSVALKAAYFEIACDGLSPFRPDMAYGVLYDGQAKCVLLVPRTFDLEDVTGFAIETKSHGVQFKPVRRFLRFQFQNVSARPRLFSLVRAVTGVPHIARAQDMKPRRSRHCTAGRRHIEIIEDQLVPVDQEKRLYRRSRRFKCGECSCEWSAHAAGLERVRSAQVPQRPNESAGPRSEV